MTLSITFISNDISTNLAQLLALEFSKFHGVRFSTILSKDLDILKAKAEASPVKLYILHLITTIDCTMDLRQRKASLILEYEEKVGYIMKNIPQYKVILAFPSYRDDRYPIVDSGLETQMCNTFHLKGFMTLQIKTQRRPTGTIPALLQLSRCLKLIRFCHFQQCQRICPFGTPSFLDFYIKHFSILCDASDFTDKDTIALYGVTITRLRELRIQGDGSHLTQRRRSRRKSMKFNAAAQKAIFHLSDQLSTLPQSS